jgi:O-antigen/teichoic acid export membrane protein
MAVWTTISLIQYGGMDWSYPFFRSQKSDELSKKEIMITSTYIATFSLLLVWAAFAIFGLFFPWLQNYANVKRIELLLFLLGLIPSALTGWYLFILRYSHHASSYARITILGKFAGAVVAIPLMIICAQENRLTVWLICTGFVSALAIILSINEFRKYDIWPYLFDKFNVKLGKKMARYGLILVPGGMVYATSTVIGRLLVGIYQGTSGVALLALSLSIGSIILMTKNWFALVWDPYLVEWISTKMPDIYTPKLQKALFGLSLFFFPMACLSILWSDLVISIIYPPYYTEVASLVPYLILTGAISILSLVAVATAMIANNPRFHLPIYSLALLVNFLISFMLIPRIGVIGAIFGNLFSEVFILLSWIILGRIILKNLCINWIPPLVFSLISIIFISLYRPGLFLENNIMIERLIITAIVIFIILTISYKYKILKDIKKVFF